MKFIIMLAACIPLSVLAQDLTKEKSLKKVLNLPNKEDIQARIKYLADDKLQGRKAGSPGYQMAVDYVISQFTQLGIEAKGDNGYLQQVVIKTAKADTTRVSIVLNDSTLQFGRDAVVMPDMNRANHAVEGEVVFIGQGISAAHLGHDDYAGIDVKGKVVLMVSGVPDKFPDSERAHFTSMAMRAEVAASKGAIGAISVITTAAAYRTARDGSAKGVQGIVNKNGRVTSRSVPVSSNMQFYVAGSVAYFRPIIEKLKKGDVVGKVSVKSFTTYTEITSYNVVGWIPGTDPELKNEFVVHSAHLDHLGIRAKIKGDSIYNGAHDNASGVACALEIAKLYKKAKLKRSVLIALVTAEEMGLLGSSYFAANPPVDKSKIVADINTDMPTLLTPMLSIEPLGAWHSSLMTEVTRAASRLNLEIMKDHVPEQVRFTRSDQYSFIREGIPALHIKPGIKSVDPAVDIKKKIDDWTRDNYHKPSDEYREDAFNWDAAITYVKLNFLIGYQIANTSQRPAWNKGDFFGEMFGGSR
jgi:Zn-dependent M28 family amino/carboxypeptidase